MRAWWSLSKAMFKGLLADKTALFFYFLFPLMFLVLFGLLLGSSTTSKVTIGVTGDGPLIRALPAKVVTTKHYDTFASAVDAVRKGDIPAAISERGDVVELRYSATDQVAAGTVQGIVQSVVGEANVQVSGRPPQFTVRAAQVEDESFQPIQYLTSGLLAWAIAMSAAFGAAMNLVIWRRNQVLRRLRMSPVSPAAVVGARIGVSLVVAIAQAAVFIGVAMTPAFGLQLRGSWWLALPLLVAGTLAFLAIGLLVGSFARTEEAASAAVNLIVLPMAFLSGVFFPIDGMPDWVQDVSWLMPMRHLSSGLLDVLVRDATIGSVLVPMGVLLGFAAVVTLIATRVFSWDT
ncbi:MAG: ABC transporter permease [Actinobacteria bacterium]|nr:ABC transporter permease [Actinomycetota bacterium]